MKNMKNVTNYFESFLGIHKEDQLSNCSSKEEHKGFYTLSFVRF